MDQYNALKEITSDERLFFKENSLPIGTVYTPDGLATMLIELAVNRFFIQNGLDKRQLTSKEQFDLLKNIKVLDLSCGTGQLILAYTKYIENLNQNVNWSVFLKECVYVVDVELEAINAFKSLINIKYGECTDFCESNIFHANALEEKLAIELNSIEIVLGNPPYIGEKGNREIFEKIKKMDFGLKYYEAKMDYFYFFIYKGYEFLKSNGVLCYLTSNYFFTADGAKKLRAFIKESFFVHDILDFGNFNPFANRKLHVCMYTLSKLKGQKTMLYDENLNLRSEIKYEQLFDVDGNIRLISDQEIYEIIEKMIINKAWTLNTVFDTSQGIVTGADREGANPVFVYKEEELQNLPKNVQQYLRPFYKNRQIKHYYAEKKPDFFLLYITQRSAPSELLELLEPYKPLLVKRREVQKKSREWYQLTWPREESIFLGDKIVVPQRAKSNYFSYVTEPFYASADVYFIRSTVMSPYSLKVLCMILNSKLYKLWLYFMGKRKGEMMELYSTPLKNIPIPNLTQNTVAKIEHYADLIWGKSVDDLELGFVKEQMDLLLCEVFGLTENEAEKLKKFE